MLKSYLMDVASTGRIQNIQLLVTNFLDEWRWTLEEIGFTIDHDGIVRSDSTSPLTYQKKILEEYLVLRCLHFALSKNTLDKGCTVCCRTDWESEHIDKEVDQHCREIFESIQRVLLDNAKPA